MHQIYILHSTIRKRYAITLDMQSQSYLNSDINIKKKEFAADQNGFLQIQNQIEGQLNHMLYNAGDFGFFSRSKGGSKRQLNHKYKM